MVKLATDMSVYNLTCWDFITYIVMVLVAQIDRVYIHATIVGPVVSQSNDQLHSCLFRSLDDFIERL